MTSEEEEKISAALLAASSEWEKSPEGRWAHRVEFGRLAGWNVVDSRLTPGIPVLGVVRPDGTPAGLLGSWSRLAGPDGQPDFEAMLRRLDELGYPTPPEAGS
jgi:hypothetical protein